MPCPSFRSCAAIAGVALLLVFGCAPTTRMGLPEPIATSPEEMPPDAARVAAAIQARITGAGQATISDVKFQGESEQRLTRTGLSNQALALKRSEFYLYQTDTDNPTVKRTSGRFDFEGPIGRRASVFYVTSYSRDATGLLVTEVRLAPIYSDCPEPIMFVVPAAALPEKTDVFPHTYLELLRYVSQRAVDSTRPASVQRNKGDYVIFIFLFDRISPSAKLEVKVSDSRSGVRGYEASTRYMDFNGWRVALLPGRFVLFDGSGEAPLFVKAVFTPGKEVSTPSRSPRLVGLFCLDGSTPE